MAENLQDVRIDVELLKKDVVNITALCQKMDTVIDKILEQQDRYLSQVYEDMDNQEKEVKNDIKELHSRITTVYRDLGDKIELTERRLLEELKDLRLQITEHNKKEDSEIQKILEWKWMAAGGILVLAWLLSHIKFDTITRLLN